MPTPDEFQAEVARLALGAARGHGFALAGGRALAAHEIIRRPTEDVDLFTATDGGVRAAATLIEQALTRAGYVVQAVSGGDDLSDLVYGFDQEMAEFEVSGGGQATRLQLVRFDRHREPVVMAIGPVLHLDDVLGSKVAALATRAEPRDYIDVAAALATRSREQLLDLAQTADPDIGLDEFADAMRRLDRLDDAVFTDLYGLSAGEATELRTRFADWPRPT